MLVTLKGLRSTFQRMCPGEPRKGQAMAKNVLQLEGHQGAGEGGGNQVN